jgi:serine/threonine-protein kinase
MAIRTLGSRYLLDEQIGQGGMGVVWRGRDKVTGAPFAIKLLRSEYAADPDAVTRFVRERTVLMKFRHPAVVTLHDMIVEGDQLALVMDLVDGGDLYAYRQRAGGALSSAEAARLSAQICDGLAAAHSAGIVHRDLKPANVLLDAGQVKLADFGVARIVGDNSATTTGTVLGTAAYLAPELLTGSDPSPASDVYAFGITLYELLAGRPPFNGHVAAIMHDHLQTAPARLANIPMPFWDLLSLCLAKDPAGRPTAAAMASALRDPALLAVLGPGPGPVAGPGRGPKAPAAGPGPARLAPPKAFAQGPMSPPPVVPASAPNGRAANAPVIPLRGQPSGTDAAASMDTAVVPGAAPAGSTAAAPAPPAAQGTAASAPPAPPVPVTPGPISPFPGSPLPGAPQTGSAWQAPFPAWPSSQPQPLSAPPLSAPPPSVLPLSAPPQLADPASEAPSAGPQAPAAPSGGAPGSRRRPAKRSSGTNLTGRVTASPLVAGVAAAVVVALVIGGLALGHIGPFASDRKTLAGDGPSGAAKSAGANLRQSPSVSATTAGPSPKASPRHNGHGSKKPNPKKSLPAVTLGSPGNSSSPKPGSSKNPGALTPYGANLVDNGNFADGTLSGWDYATENAEVNPGSGPSSANAVQLTADPQAGVAEVITGLTPGTHYLVTGWAQESQSPIFIGAMNDDGAGDGKVHFTVRSGTWTYGSVIFTLGRGQRSAVVFCVQANGSGSCADITFRAMR